MPGLRPIPSKFFFLVGVILAASGGVHAQTWIGGADSDFETAGNWTGGVAPTQNGTATILLSNSGGTITVFSSADILGLQQLNPGGVQYSINQGGSGSLTIQSGGISFQAGAEPILFFNIPIILGVNQTWSGSNGGFIYTDGGVTDAGMNRTLTIDGRVYMVGVNTFSGGTIVLGTGTLNAGAASAAGTGTLTLEDGATLQSFSQPVDLSNPIALGNNVVLGTDLSTHVLTLSGSITATNPATSVTLNSSSSLVVTGNVDGPASTQLTLSGQGSQLPFEGGSQLVYTGDLSSRITALTINAASVILAPTDTPTNAFGGVTGPNLTVTNQSYLGLDGRYTQAGAVSSFLSTFGSQLGTTIDGTLGFDTFASPSTPNSFGDPINLAPFGSESFVGLGSATSAILTSTAVITPTPANTYPFGGGGGTLTVQSNLNDVSGTQLVMNAGSSPLTLILQGMNLYSGGTVANGGVLIFDSAVPAGTITEGPAGYVGYTENASNIVTASDFISRFSVNSTQGVIGFDATFPAEGRTISDPIDLHNFTSEGTPFIGSSAASPQGVTLSGLITPANSQYEFTGVKGGRLTIASDLTLADSLTIGLPNPIENSRSSSAVVLEGSNAAVTSVTLNSGTLFLNNDNALGAGTLSVPDTAATIVTPVLAPFGGTVTLSNLVQFGTITVNSSPAPGLAIGNPGTADMLVLSGVLSDVVPGTNAGFLGINGQVTLSGNNTYSGGTTFLGSGNSTAFITKNSAFGTGPITMKDSGLIVPQISNVTLSNPITIGPNTTLFLSESGNTAVLSLSGVISGQGGLTIQGDTDILGTSNTYTGATLISQANVVVSGLGSFGPGSLQIDNGSTLEFQTGNPTFLDLQGDSGSTLAFAPSQVITLNADVAGGSFQGTFAGDGSNSLIKAGIGIQDLSGVSTYGGGTSVNA